MIELVVKLPEQAYEVIKRNDVGAHAHNLALLTKWIADGIPLPKGHGRLIDADAVLEDPIGDTYKDIDIAETIIEADEEGEKDGRGV